jgi:hypothetical protein
MLGIPIPHTRQKPRTGNSLWGLCSASTSAVVLLTNACFSPDESVTDPFDPMVVPRIQITELTEIGCDIDSSVPVLNKVTDAIFMGGDEIALASDEGEILVFGMSGDFRRRLGRRGDGPGEFQFVQKIVRLNENRILAWDPALDRVTVFEQDGRLDRTCTPGWAMEKQAGVGFVGAFADGSFVLEDMSYRRTPEGTPDGLRSDTIPYLLFDRSGKLVGTIGQFVRPLRYYDAATGYQRYLFASSVLSGVVGDEIWVGENDSIVFHRFDSTGTPLTARRLYRSPRRVTEPDIEAGWRAWEAQMVKQQGQMMEQMAASFGGNAAEDMARARAAIEPAEFLPQYESILVGSDRSIWLEDYLHPTEEVTRWFVLGEDFLPVGWVEFEPNERLLAVGAKRLIVLRKDELEVESVVVYGGEWPVSF